MKAPVLGKESLRRASEIRWKADVIKFRWTLSSEIKSLLLLFSAGLNVQNVANKG
jgi:hypothetical protein